MYSRKGLTEEEARTLIENAERRFPTRPSSDWAVPGHAFAGVFVVRRSSTILDAQGKEETLPAGESIKVLDWGHESGEDWVYTAKDVLVTLPGGRPGQLKEGEPLAVLAPDYKEQLKRHAEQINSSDESSGQG